jgi:hypothetical protein
MKRTLSLKSEHLAELSTDELASVAAGGANLPTLPADYCLTLSCPAATCNCCTASSSC